MAGSDSHFPRRDDHHAHPQDEAWLAGLLGAFMHAHGLFDLLGSPPGRLRAPLEAAIRVADPCLPCTSLPFGRMSVRLRISDAASALVASWLLEPPSVMATAGPPREGN